MGKHYKDLLGLKFGRLTVNSLAGQNSKKQMIWHCECDCGNYVDVPGSRLTNGSTQSCGCLQKELARQRRIKSNEYDLTGQYGVGYTTKGEPFYFDIEDYDLIKDYCWRLRKDGYLDAKIRDGSNKRVLMHNLIMNQIHIDHVGGIESRNDNRKENLRIPPDDYSFDTYNQMNKSKQSNNKSGCPGVCWHKRDKVWEVHISLNGIQKYLGRFNEFEEAVKIRKAAEKEYFGEYSYDNSQFAYYF